MGLWQGYLRGPILAEREVAIMKFKSFLREALSVAAVALIFGAAAPAVWADSPEEIELDEAEVFFELNDTDEDLGIHSLIDGDAWWKLEIEDSEGKKILMIRNQGRLRAQGLTELFFESAEPTFDELFPEEFFDRFPEGEYTIEGTTLEGDVLVGEAEVTHVMPAPPVPTVNLLEMAEQCDDEEPASYDATVTSAPVTIAWAEVTMSHPDLGVDPAIPVTIHNYEVVVEVETEDEFEAVFSVILPPDATSMTIPEEFTELGDVFKYEVLAREESYNQTAVESCFVLE
jgi:hypothetical protein